LATHPIRLVIFDVAGTIIEDHGEVLDAFSQALKGNGIAFTEAELREWKGASKREVIHHFVKRQFGDDSRSPTKIDATYANFRSQLESHYRERGVSPIPGAQSTFAWLRERNIEIATTTGFYRELNDLILDQAGWHDMFRASISSSDVEQGRPAPDMILRAMEATSVTNPAQVINVGDTPLDLQAGTNAGVRGVIGVLTGAHGRERLMREPHTHILTSVADLPTLIDKEYS
jgi:phosphonatase-like hydrolase